MSEHDSIAHPRADVERQNDVMTSPRQLDGDRRRDLVRPKDYREGARVAIE